MSFKKILKELSLVELLAVYQSIDVLPKKRKKTEILEICIQYEFIKRLRSHYERTHPDNIIGLRLVDALALIQMANKVKYKADIEDCVKIEALTEWLIKSVTKDIENILIHS